MSKMTSALLVAPDFTEWIGRWESVIEPRHNVKIMRGGQDRNMLDQPLADGALDEFPELAHYK